VVFAAGFAVVLLAVAFATVFAAGLAAVLLAVAFAAGFAVAFGAALDVLFAGAALVGAAFLVADGAALVVTVFLFVVVDFVALLVGFLVAIFFSLKCLRTNFTKTGLKQTHERIFTRIVSMCQDIFSVIDFFMQNNFFSKKFLT